MKDTLGIKRREIHARGSDMLELRISCLGGYTNIPEQWPWFLDQRGKDAHTQLETREVASLISEAIS